MSPHQRQLAEDTGFEPVEEDNPLGSLAGNWFKPTHPILYKELEWFPI